MKFRVCRNEYFPTYFRTKKEAVAFAARFEGTRIERKIGGEWYAA